MSVNTQREQIVADVCPCSPAEAAGIKRGDALLCINGEAVQDIVDYEYLSASESLCLDIRSADGALRNVAVSKEEYEPLGLSFVTGLMSDMRSCRNHCIFCFIDQMPKGVRSSLHVKDDDWRMSFIMGNYVTLTNVDEAEFTRMIRRRVSPLYISLHASDPRVRIKMMHNPSAGEIMERLMRLRDAGLRFHLQIVLCPGVNDGEVLLRTLSDIETLMPAAQSLAIVPVGLTKYRDGLYPLRLNTRDEARQLIKSLQPWQARWMESFNTRFAFLSDEWYILADMPLPDYAAYEDFPQIENGVGLLRSFEHDFREALSMHKARKRRLHITMAGGASACRFFGWMPETLKDYGVLLDIVSVSNEYFGGGVNVGGLITGGDLVSQLAGRLETKTLLIPRAMLRENEDVFLDGMHLCEVEAALGVKLIAVSDGINMIETLFRRTL